ncbi:MAG: type II toxin-antitoxin system RelE/ParE family toxin [Spirochaetales bacterium]|jgi:plasmid stabilization system protein ParE|nr:type II toxin-antitoxin system RelE/ParE family toxin [Spirochaetales bacterium]MBR6200466.1 type II toxin-antitoxin system RelE/ParE family toxin [Spirochaetales bacterium]
MAYKVTMSESSKLDIANIISYIREDLQNSKAAKMLLKDFNRQKNFLKLSPYMFQFCPDEILQQKGYRRFIFYKKYVAVYRIDKINKQVRIMRVFYGKREYEHLV